MEKWEKTTLNFVRRVSKSIVKCCSVDFPWSAVYYNFFCLPKQFFIFLFFFSVVRSIVFGKKSEKQENKLVWPYGLLAWRSVYPSTLTKLSLFYKRNL